MKKYLLFLSLGIVTTATDSLAMLGKFRTPLKNITKQTYRLNSTQSQNKNSKDKAKADSKLNLIKALISFKNIYCNNTWLHFQNNKNIVCSEPFLDALKMQNASAINAINDIQKTLKETELTSYTKDILNSRLNEMRLNINENTNSINVLENNNPQIFSEYYEKHHPYIQKIKKSFFIKSSEFNEFTESLTNNYENIELTKNDCFIRISQDLNPEYIHHE
jgi:hypothetical protein